MFREHASYIKTAVELEGIPGLLNVQRFTLATIRFPLWQAALASNALLTGDGDLEAAARQILWGSKRKGWEYLETSAADVNAGCAIAHALDASRAPTADIRRFWEAQTLLAIARTPGIGLVKAGFVTQMAFGFGGCIDTHNLRRFGLEAKDVVLGSIKLDGGVATDKALRYVELCERCGGCAELWDGWCTYVAEKQPNRYASADVVSFWHLVGLGYAS